MTQPTEPQSRWSLWEFLKGKKKYEAPLNNLKYSLTTITKKDGKKKEGSEQLLTLTIPNLPLRAWYPHDKIFNPPDEVKVIIFEADGFMLERIPETADHMQEPVVEQVTPMVELEIKKEEFSAAPLQDLEPDERRGRSRVPKILVHGVDGSVDVPSCHGEKSGCSCQWFDSPRKPGHRRQWVLPGWLSSEEDE